MGLLTRDRRRFAFSSPNGKKRLDRSAQTLTASGDRVTHGQGDKLRRLIQPWQHRAYGYYDIVPEIKYAAQFYSRALSVLRLYAAKLDEQGEPIEIEDENDPGVVELDRIQDPGGGRSNLLAQYGRLIFLGGEALLLVTSDPETHDEQWEMLSPDELRMMGDTITRYKAPSLAAQTLKEAPDDDYEPITDDEAVVYRLWKRHPRYSALADASMQGVLDVCEELVLLTQAVRARTRSRLAGAGILLINGKVSPIPQGGDTADENLEEDPFIAALIESMVNPIRDEGTAAAVVPLVVRADVDDLDKAMKHLQIVDPTQFYPETGLRKEAIERLAIGLDMPPEVLLGIGDANHWSAWQVDEQTWKGHLQPIAQQLVDDLTAAYYRPTLRESGVQDWRDYVIAYDATAIINHPDLSANAKDLYDRRAVGKAALRAASGFDEDDEMTEDELYEQIGVQVRDASLAVYGIPSVKAGGIEPSPGEIVGPQGVQVAPGSEKAAPGSTAAEVEAGTPPEPTVAEQQAPPTPGAVIGAARILGASDLALHRARELAGARLRSYARRDKAAAKLLEGIRNPDVAPTLGREGAATIGAPDARQLVAGTADLIADSLRLWRLDPALAIPLGERIEQHAARTLYDERPSPLPPSFENYVAGLNGEVARAD